MKNEKAPKATITINRIGAITSMLDCDFWGRKINITNSKTLVSRPTVTRVTFDLHECEEPLKNEKMKETQVLFFKKKNHKK